MTISIKPNVHVVEGLEPCRDPYEPRFQEIYDAFVGQLATPQTIRELDRAIANEDRRLMELGHRPRGDR